MQLARCDTVARTRRNFIVRADSLLWCFAVAAAGLHGQQQLLAHVLDVKGSGACKGQQGW
jgi:hypothetical protein